jgi:hypothetical protein
LAQRHVALRLNPTYLPQLTQIATVAYSAARNANLPADFLKQASNTTYDDDGIMRPILPLPEAVVYLGQKQQGYTLFNARQFCYIINQDLYLEASYSKNVYLPYIAIPANLSADGDVSKIEDGVIDLVVLKAAADALVKTKQLNEIQVLYKMLEDRIDRMNGVQK